jgi:hypothetical protein
MLLTIFAIWTVFIPVAILAIGSDAANRREVRSAQNSDRSTPDLVVNDAKAPRGRKAPRCARRVGRAGRATARRGCPELAGNAGRRTSA